MRAEARMDVSRQRQRPQLLEQCLVHGLHARPHQADALEEREDLRPGRIVRNRRPPGRGDFPDDGRSAGDAFRDAAPQDVLLPLGRFLFAQPGKLTPAVADDRPEPIRKRLRWTERLLQIAELQVRVRVDQPGEQRDVAQVDRVCGRLRMDRDDPSVPDLDAPLAQRRRRDRNDETSAIGSSRHSPNAVRGTSINQQVPSGPPAASCLGRLDLG